MGYARIEFNKQGPLNCAFVHMRGSADGNITIIADHVVEEHDVYHFYDFVPDSEEPVLIATLSKEYFAVSPLWLSQEEIAQRKKRRERRIMLNNMML